MSRNHTAVLFFICIASCLYSVAQSRPAYLDPTLSPEQRADALVSQMTLDEKVSQVVHTADGIPRLHIPEYDWWNEGLHGVARAGYATVFPQAIGMAAMFDEPLMHRIATTISTEFRAKYYATLHPDGSSDWYRGLTVWSPNINIFRDPRWGRGQETYGEDPYLTSRLGVAFVTGLQGDNPKYFKTIATSKHFAVHSGPELTRHTVDVHASAHDMEDTYFPAFRATVMDAKVGSVMCAYNSLNGEPACANTDLLQRHLRQDWHFQGYVVSDCGAVTDIFQGHHYATSIEQATADAFKTGTDLICGVPPQDRVKYEREGLKKAVQQGLLAESVLDTALRRLFEARIRLGMFDPPGMVPYSGIKPSENDTEAHRQLAHQAARESIVLLKNANGLLPLKRAYRTIAVIGPNADSIDALVGNYNGTPSKPVTILAGIQKRFAQSRVIYAQGTGLVGPMTAPIEPKNFYTNESRKQHGVNAEYFNNPQLQGPPAFTRVDPAVNFNWGDAGITPQLLKNYSVRWMGVLVPSETADYLLGFTGEDGYRVWLDGKLIVQDWEPHRPASTETAKVHLEAGHAYKFKIEYYQLVRFSEARFIWSVPEGFRDAVNAARSADVVIVALGLSPRIEGEEMKVDAEGFAGGDRTRIDLPSPQQELLKAVHAVGKPTILLLLNGSALAVNWANENIPAILEAWYPGEEGGAAVAEMLAGDFSPGGRLPVTFYKSIEQLPPFDDYSMANRTYRYFHGEPLYPFGYGLSYTTFRYQNIRVDHQSTAANGWVVVSVDVSNTGNMEGDEVVQLYLSHSGVAGAPLRALEGFQRLHLAPHQQTTVSFPVRDRQLSTVDEQGKHQIVPGPVDVWVGGGQPVMPAALGRANGLQTRFTITDTATLPN